MSTTLARACPHGNDLSQVNITLWQYPSGFSALLANPIQSSASIPGSLSPHSVPHLLGMSFTAVPQEVLSSNSWTTPKLILKFRVQNSASCLPRPSQDPQLSHFVVSSNWYSVQSSGNPSPSHPCLFSVNQRSFSQTRMLFCCVSVIMIMSPVSDWTWISSWLLPRLCRVMARHLRKVCECPHFWAGMWKVPLVVFPLVSLLHLQLLLLYF